MLDKSVAGVFSYSNLLENLDSYWILQSTGLRYVQPICSDCIVAAISVQGAYLVGWIRLLVRRHVARGCLCKQRCALRSSEDGLDSKFRFFKARPQFQELVFEPY